jgi:hypothetical protein
MLLWFWPGAAFSACASFRGGLLSAAGASAAARERQRHYLLDAFNLVCCVRYQYDVKLLGRQNIADEFSAPMNTRSVFR